MHASDIAATSVLDGIRRAAAAHPHKLAVIDLPTAAVDEPGISITYSDVLARITRSANLLRSFGILPGDAVAFIAPSTLSALIAFWAGHAAGAIAPLNPFLALPALTDIVTATGASVIISGGADSGDGSFAKARDLMATVPGIRHHLVTDGDPGGNAISIPHAAAAFDGATLSGPEPGLDDIVAYFATGGTTGAPKVAKLSNRNLLVCAWSTATASSTDPDHILPAGLPLFHVGGGVIGNTRALLLGQTCVLLTPAGYRSPDVVANFWQIAKRWRFSQMTAVPTVYSDLLRTYSGEGTTIGMFVAGASKLPGSLCAAYERTFGVGIHEGYGMTECSGLCTVNPVMLPPRVGSGGIVAPLYKIRTVRLDAAGRYERDCATDETGMIAVAGPGVFQGYTDAGHTAAKFIAGMTGDDAWLNTGDLGHCDADGFLWVTGREKDLIIRGGHNIDPAAIEDVLLGHDAIVDAAAVGMPDARVGELPVAFVQTASGAPFDEDELRRFCAAALHERASTPVRIFTVDALPRTAMKKIYKPELRRLAADAAVRAALSALDPASPGTRVSVRCDASGCVFAEIDAGQSDDRIVETLNLLNIHTIVRESPA